MSAVRIGVISDTHGVLRSQAREILRGGQQIVHAGDIDHPLILRELEAIAPTTAVRGNMSVLKVHERIQVDRWAILLVHNINDLPDLEGTDIVIFGHSHKFLQENRGGVLFLNPGSAGPRRFNIPISMAVLSLGETITVEPMLLKSQP